MSGRERGELGIGAVAEASGITPQTVRYYEEIGLLPPPRRSGGGQRLYGPAQRERLAFIRHARELGFGLEAIRELLTLAGHPDEPCRLADSIAATHLAEVRHKIARLRSLERELKRMLEQCRGGRAGECHVLEVLADADHGRCLDPDHGDPAE